MSRPVAVASFPPAPRPVRLSADPEAGRITVSALPLGALAVFLLHAPLALAMHRVPAAATLHALGTFVLGAAVIGLGSRPERVAYFVAYFAGSEVLWRMCRAQVFWEYGKYGAAALMIIALARIRPLRWPWAPLLYVLLLIPSAAMTFAELDFAEAKSRVSFNLSGPLTLFLSVWLFSHLQIPEVRRRRVVIAFVAPVIGIAAISLYSTLTAESISFTQESNPTTSGGFGPNQVSAILGLGALLTLLASLERGAPKIFRVLMFGASLLLAGQSALTFSRGGLVGAGLAVCAAMFFLWRDSRSRLGSIVATALLVLTSAYLIIPRLDAMTGGTLSTRFESMDVTHRDDIAKDDLRVWLQHPLLGVGPGGSRFERESGLPAHTEFSRLPAEHGMFGLGALLLLLYMSAWRLRAARTAQGRALVASMVTWSFATMLHAAMRTVAPSFIFGLAFAGLSDRPDCQGEEPPDDYESGVPADADVVPVTDEHPAIRPVGAPSRATRPA